MSVWEVRCEVAEFSSLEEYRSPMVELDVAHCRLNLAVGTPNAMHGSEVTGGLVRRYLEGDAVDWAAAAEWAKNQQALFARISTGTTREMMWSGDTVVHWTEDAAAAADALFEGIGERC